MITENRYQRFVNGLIDHSGDCYCVIHCIFCLLFPLIVTIAIAVPNYEIKFEILLNPIQSFLYSMFWKITSRNCSPFFCWLFDITILKITAHC